MVRTLPLSKQTRGFTLPEILIVLSLTVMVCGMLILLIREITASSQKGIISADGILETRRILEIVKDDLKHQCFPTVGREGSSIRIAEQITESGTPPFCRFSFLRFPKAGSLEESVPRDIDGSGASPRRATLITYIIQPTRKGFFPMSLVREEAFPPQHPEAQRLPDGKRSRIISNRISFFEIRPLELRLGKQYLYYFQITVQVAATLGDASGGSPPRTIILDFFDTVYPEFVMTLLQNRGYNPVWQGGIIGPTPLTNTSPR
ncbi:MAG: prepilin-type N-terminal cleavage/methylation domain-containing protein [Candidatus Ozemobacteraceae bacterium]